MLRIRQVEVFRAVMVHGGITRAADALHVTQPAVTRLIRDLETETGLALFQRKGRRVYPTAEAEQLYAEVERSFVGLARVDEFARALRSGHRGALTIACMPALSIGFVPRFAAEFFGQSPNYDLRINSHGSRLVREMVASGQADIGFSAVPFTHDLLTAQTINDPAVAVIPATHRLAAKKVVRANDFDGQTVILIDTGAFGGHSIQSALRRARPKNIIATQASSVACAMVCKGIGVSIVDPFSASEYVGHGLVARRFEPNLSLGFAIIRPRHRPTSRIAEEFIVSFVRRASKFLESGEVYRIDGP